MKKRGSYFERLLRQMQQSEKRLQENGKENARKLEENVTENIKRLEENAKENVRKIEENVKECSRKLEQKLDNSTKKIEVTVMKLAEELEQTRKDLRKEQTKKEMNENIHVEKRETYNIIKDVQEMVVRNREHSDKAIEEVRKHVEVKLKNVGTKNMAYRIQVVVNPSLMRGDNDLKFYEDGKVHPIVFLKQLIERVEAVGDGEDYK